MPRIQLSANACLLATCNQGKRKTDYWDTHTPGFVLEVRPSGGKTYYLRYFDQAGRQRQHKIGGHADISFDQARKAARRLRSETVLGGDPSGAKEQKKAIPTYAELAEQHLAHGQTYMRSYNSLETNMRLHILPRWGKLRLDEITPQAIALWLAEKNKEGLAPATVSKILITFHKSFELARQWSIPGSDKNPVRGVPRPQFDNRRERFLSAEEAGRLLNAADNSKNVQLRPIVELLLLTGSRLSELLHARRSDVDLKRQSWLIPQTKNGQVRRVPLSRAAVDIINNLPVFDDCPWLVPNPDTRRPFVTIKHSWMKARKDAALPGLRLHDARHSAASFMLAGGTSLFTIGSILGHKQVASTARYSHLSDETLLSAVEAGASKLSAQLAT